MKDRPKIGQHVYFWLPEWAQAQPTPPAYVRRWRETHMKTRG